MCKNNINNYNIKYNLSLPRNKLIYYSTNRKKIIHSKCKQIKYMYNKYIILIIYIYS